MGLRLGLGLWLGSAWGYLSCLTSTSATISRRALVGVGLRARARVRDRDRARVIGLGPRVN